MPDLRKYRDFFKKNKYLFIVLAIGIILLILPSGKNDKVKVDENRQIEFSIDEWEEKLEKILAECEGVGRVKVALAVSGTAESVYAQEESLNTRKNSDDYTKDSDKKISVLSTGSGVEAPVVIRELYPEFLGATVVCDGADYSGVCINVTGAVSSLTGLSSDKITIIKMKN